MYQNRPDVGNIIPITRLRPDCFTFCKMSLHWYLKKMSTENVLSVLKYTIIHHFQVGSDIANQKSYHDEKST